MVTKKRKADFINNEIWILTFGGALQRAYVYADGVTDAERLEFRNGVRGEISRLVNAQYVNAQVTSEAHIQNLIELQNWININYHDVLMNENINLGVVQKLLNLYLKYQWCLGLVQEPPHCPFDRTILSILYPHPIPAWTQCNNVKQYREWVNMATEEANEEGCESIAEWELATFQRGA